MSCGQREAFMSKRTLEFGGLAGVEKEEVVHVYFFITKSGPKCGKNYWITKS